jgi:hypothetical protein
VERGGHEDRLDQGSQSAPGPVRPREHELRRVDGIAVSGSTPEGALSYGSCRTGTTSCRTSSATTSASGTPDKAASSTRTTSTQWAGLDAVDGRPRYLEADACVLRVHRS